MCIICAYVSRALINLAIFIVKNANLSVLKVHPTEVSRGFRCSFATAEVASLSPTYSRFFDLTSFVYLSSLEGLSHILYH